MNRHAYSYAIPEDKPIMLWIVIGLFVLIGTVYSVTIPIFEASDEVWHYPMVDYIADFGALPVQPLEPGQSSGPWRQEGSQPPLYYALGAALTFWIDRSDLDQVRSMNPHVSAGEVTLDKSNLNLVLHNPDLERFPWQGTVLAVHIVRLLSVALGAWAVYLTWTLVRELFPETAWIAGVSAAIHAFTPMYLFVSSTVNNDNLIVPLCTLSLLWMVRLIKSASDKTSPRQRLQRHVALGAVLGLATLTKATGIGLLPLAAATVFWEAWQLPVRASVKDRARFFLKSLAAMTLPILVISGWWFYRNYRLYGDWLGLNAFHAVLGTRDVPASLFQLWSERFAFSAGYWGNFGGLTIPLPDFIYHILNGVAIIAAIGLIIRFSKWLLEPIFAGHQKINGVIDRLWPFNWQNLTAARAIAWAWPAAVFVSWIRWATITWSSQGRLIFSAIPMWSLGLSMGLNLWTPKRLDPKQNSLPIGLSASLLVLTLVSLPVWIWPTYAPPVLDRRPDPEAYGMTPLDVTYGDVLRLIGYEIETQEARPDQPVEFRLLWQALAPSEENHSIFIHVLGDEDRIVAQRDAFPGRGLMSTTRLEPQATWIESYAVPIPATAYTPDTLSLLIGVYNTTTGTRLPVSNAEASQFQKTLGRIPMPLREGQKPNPIDVVFGEGIGLRGYELSSLSGRVDEAIDLTLHWACQSPIDHNYTISAQLIDAEWRKAAQSDGWPQDGAAPTSSWVEGQTLQEVRTLEINEDALPGLYNLQITIYRVDEEGTLVHLPVIQEVGEMPAQALVLTTLRVEE